MIATLLGLIFFILFILASVFWIWMLIDAIRNNRLDSTEKLIWVLVIIFLHGLGALLYFLIARGKGLT
jgi:cytochrome c oxidase assembly factor CtaG